jgi:hypothetical protein
MKERPILFSAPMVRALLDGRKTMTRRVVKPQPPFDCSYAINGARTHALCYQTSKTLKNAVWVPPTPKSTDHRLPCPYGQPGDRLWVRETFALEPKSYAGDKVIYRADEKPTSGAWKPSIFMPRWASRITLEITGVRVERLQDITTADIDAEGVDNGHTNRMMGKRHEAMQSMAWEALWKSINGAESWQANPWVWVIEFRRIEA